MAVTPLFVRLPDELVRRFRRNVAVRQRSRFIQRLLEDALPAEDTEDDPLYRAAVAVEADTALVAEMAEWEAATLDDGLSGGGKRRRRRNADQ
jgi:metal-responsive CopG/Arc/MetJ family transcriptional regulator